MKTSVTIREFSPIDYNQVSKLWREHGDFHEELDERPLILEMLKRNPHLLLVAEKENKIIGTAFASFDGRLGLVYRLIIHPDHRQQGFGSVLMTELEDRLRKIGCQIIGLLVLNHNKAAIEMYKKRGYVPLPQVGYMYKQIAGGR